MLVMEEHTKPRSVALQMPPLNISYIHSLSSIVQQSMAAYRVMEKCRDFC